MTFANPFGLVGLLSLPVVLALHLLRERQQRYVVSDLNLWSFLDHEVHGPRLRRIPLSLLLLLDLSVAFLLSLAWAQPRLSISLPVQDARHMVILMDVSSSMRARDGLVDRFSQAKREAISLLNSAGPRDVVTVLAFGRAPRWVGDSRQDSYEQLAAGIENLQAGETGYSLQAALALGLASRTDHLPVRVHVFTDGAFPEAALPDSGGAQASIEWRWFGQPTGNQAVLELNAASLGENRYQVFARIANFSSQEIQRSAALLVNGEMVDSTVLRIPADSKVPQIWEITAGSSSQDPAVITVSLSDQDRFSEDDSATIGLQPGGNLRVVLVAENPAPIDQALQAVPEVDLQVFPPQDYARQAGLPPAELTVLRGFLPDVLPAGQILLLEPPSSRQAEPGSLSLVARNQRDIPANAYLQVPNPDPVLSGIDFGGVRWSRAWALAEPPGDFSTLLQAGDMPLLMRGQVNHPEHGPAPILVLLADLARGNFTKHPAFPILIANIVQGVRQTSPSTYLQTGEVVQLPLRMGYETLRVTPPGNAPLEFNRDWPEVWENTLDPGLYRFTWEDAAGNTAGFIAGVNAGDETESDLRPRDWTVAPDPEAGSDGWFSAGSSRATQDNPGRDDRQLELLPWLLSAAILILLLEAILAWR